MRDGSVGLGRVVRGWLAVGAAAGALGLAGCSGLKDAGGVRGGGESAAVARPAERSGEEWTNPKDGQRMALVPAGEFIMGSDAAGADEKPVRRVYLDAFRIGKAPVTVGQYRRFCEATGRAMPEPPRWGWTETHPMVKVSWEDADAYCQWAGLALPTEAQWEKAARGTDGRVYPWGSDWDPAKAVCSVAPAKSGSTAPVGSKAAGASPYGCLDMAGNVWQWCADWFDEGSYASGPLRNPSGAESGSVRALRGASWCNRGAGELRTSVRNSEDPMVCDENIGFRAVSRPGSL